MADPDEKDQEEAGEEKVVPAKKSRFSWIKRVWVVRIIVASLIVHTVGFGFYFIYYPNVAWNKLGREESLGRFHFENGLTEGVVISRADFNLHVSLLEGMEENARILLKSRALKIEQDIQQLLRHAKQADFEDPSLAEIKRQIQETINGILKTRIIEEILITDLDIEKPPKKTVVKPSPDAALASGQASADWLGADTPE